MGVHAILAAGARLADIKYIEVFANQQKAHNMRVTCIETH